MKRRKILRGEWEMMRRARPDAKRIQQLVDGEFVTWWVPRLGGHNIMHNDSYKYATRTEARSAARAERDAMSPWEGTEGDG